MTKQESLRILDQCIAYLDSLSDEEINKLADEADEYMSRPFDCSEAGGFEIILPVSEEVNNEVHNMEFRVNDSKKYRWIMLKVPITRYLSTKFFLLRKGELL